MVIVHLAVLSPLKFERVTSDKLVSCSRSNEPAHYAILLGGSFQNSALRVLSTLFPLCLLIYQFSFHFTHYLANVYLVS